MSEGLVERPAEGVVLGYAQQQKYWERGVMWLVGIVCVSQVLALVGAAGKWSMELARLRARVAFMFPTDPVAAVLEFGGAMTILPLGSILLAGFLLLMLMGVKWCRRPMIVTAWVLTGVGCLVDLALRVNELRLSPAMIEERWQMFRQFTGAVETNVLWTYPLVLLALVTRRRGGVNGVAAGTIWWLTATACMVFALPTVLLWSFNFEECIVAATQDVFMTQPSRSPVPAGSVLRGIGTISGAMACFSAYVVTIWTVRRGPKGRVAMMICAALLLVSAVGINVGELLWQERIPFWSGWWTWELEVSAAAPPLHMLVLGVAFPLAIRMALSLSEVRARLDGIRTAAPEK